MWQQASGDLCTLTDLGRGERFLYCYCRNYTIKEKFYTEGRKRKEEKMKMAILTTALSAEFIPWASPPLVKTARTKRITTCS